MLAELCIRDLALIEEADVSFTSGLNVVTGETGAGKSLVVGALECLLGQRVRGGAESWVRDGAARARVDARFVLDEPGVRRRVRDWLAAHLPELLADGDGEESALDELIVGRSLSVDGRSRAHVDQRPVPLRDLRRLAALLLEIHGQNDHQALLEPGEQLRLLDLFGDLEPKVRRYAEKRRAWRELAERAERESAARAERRDLLDLARYQLAELEEAAAEPGEADELRGERTVLRHAEALRGELGGLVEELFEREGSAAEALRRAETAVARWAERAPRLAECAEQLAGAAAHLEDAVSTLTSFVDGVEADPLRLEVVEGRLDELERLERKYELPADRLAERAAELRARVEGLEREDDEASGLGERVAEAREELVAAAEGLTRARRRLRAKLAKAVQGSLAELGLERAVFELAVEPREAGGEDGGEDAGEEDGGGVAADLRRFGPRGADRVEFLLAANPGEPGRPLARVASGGEAARIMLALRSVLAACDRGRTLVFDEVDAGVGGRLGPAVGRHLRAVAAGHQVFVVTHLPAIAAAADEHLRVTKQVAGERTSTRVEPVAGDARVEEVAVMIAGSSEAASARAEARRLLRSR